jgi:hypothetical protein
MMVILRRYKLRTVKLEREKKVERLWKESGRKGGKKVKEILHR